MGVVKLSTAGILDYSKTSNFLSGNDPYIPAVPAFDFIETVAISTGGSFVSLTGLDAYSDYKHLQIRYTVNSQNLGSGSDTIFVFTNNIRSGVAYSHNFQVSNSFAVEGQSVSAGDYSNTIGYMSVRGTNSQMRTAGILDILDFSNPNKNTTFRCLSGRAFTGSNQVMLTSGFHNQTSAVTRLDIESYSGFAADSRFSIYGVK